MTNDYKKYLLDYLTNVEVGTPTSEEIIKETEEIARSKWVDYIPSGWESFRLEGMIKSRTTDRIVFYGGYVEKNGTYQANSKGIIIITDLDLNPLKTIYKYSSGTDLRPIQCMFQEEDGQFIAVDSTIMYTPGYTQELLQALITNEKRVIMLSDISMPINDEYKVILRRSYILGDSYKNFICKEIYKNPSTSHYLFIGLRIVYDGTYDPDGVRVINLVINVGSSNEWGVRDSSNNVLYGGGFTYFDSNDVAQWKVLLNNTSNNNQSIFVWEGTDVSSSHTTTIFDPSYRAYIDSANDYNQVAFINENKAYFVMNNQRWGNTGVLRDKYIGLFEVDLVNYVVNEIYLKYIGQYDYVNLDSMFLQVVNGELYISYCDNVDTVEHTADYHVQRFKGKWNPILVKETGKYMPSQRTFYVSQTFNLLKQYLLPINLRSATWFMEQVSEVYNLANYNGEKYEDYNSLKAKYGNIYSNNKIVFSRNLHNLSITNNYSVASIEVPNTYLNDINLNLKELVGENNGVLVEDGRTITKNIYEVLYLNYINTINVKNNDNEVIRDLGMYVNANINTGTKTNQNNTRCDTCLINYSDNSIKTFNIGWTSIDDTHKYTEFTIYVDKQIESIELTSHDLTKTYITIRQELEVGKYYTFKQYLKVE